ncbi:MAG: SRPBCC domain-containing protein [Microcoleus sp. SIO2G3]|nr:SRPBCC domain-containing protein [Microcoleus sp. SIO2G3]
MNPTVKLETFYPHPPERVWQALTDRRALAAWLMDNNFEPRLGHKFQFRQVVLPGVETVIDAEVVALEPPKRLAYRWREAHTLNPAIVTWTLTAVEGGTLLHLEHNQAVLLGRSPQRFDAIPRKQYESPTNTLRLELLPDRLHLQSDRVSTTLVMESRLIVQAQWSDRLIRLDQELAADNAINLITKPLQQSDERGETI